LQGGRTPKAPGILLQASGAMTQPNTNLRLEAARTGRQDACPTVLRRGVKEKKLAP
jgi:hypothetical protein